MKKSVLGAALLLLGLPACASTKPAQEAQTERAERRAPGANAGAINSVTTGGIWLAGLDRDGDYVVTKAEFETGKAKAFDVADRDESKTLTLFELDDWRVKALGSEDASPGRFMFDPDFDQKISLDEFSKTIDGLFMRTDKDGNGVIERSELIRIIDRGSRGRGQGAGERSGQGAGRGRRQGGGGQGRGR